MMDVDTLVREVARAKPVAWSPTRDNQRAYRDALGQFATGVTIVTAAGVDDDADHPGPVGMTVNSFASVSLDPPLVLWSLAKSAHRFEPLIAARYYSIHVLRDTQQAMALDFARHPDAFSQCNWSEGAHRVPHLHDTLTRFDCRQVATHDAGDHVIIVGHVELVQPGQGEAMVFASGTFGKFSAG